MNIRVGSSPQTRVDRTVGCQRTSNVCAQFENGLRSMTYIVLNVVHIMRAILHEKMAMICNDVYRSIVILKQSIYVVCTDHMRRRTDIHHNFSVCNTANGKES